LTLGSLPGVRTQAAAGARRTLEAYVDHYLEEEIRREALVREMGPFLVFLRLAATESGRQINLARLSQESGVAASTLKTYYQVLVDTFVGHWMPAYSRRVRTRLLTTPRFYFFDLGVRNAAADLPLDARVPDALGGPLLEHWVAQDLIARASYLGRGHRVTFWRTRSGAEVDFIWEAPREEIPIEVKWTARPAPPTRGTSKPSSTSTRTAPAVAWWSAAAPTPSSSPTASAPSPGSVCEPAHCGAIRSHGRTAAASLVRVQSGSMPSPSSSSSANGPSQSPADSACMKGAVPVAGCRRGVV
jgi:hypothetical protein